MAVTINRKVTAQLINRSNNRILKQLRNSRNHRGTQIWESIISLQRELPQSEQVWKDRIENQRKNLLRQEEPLIDGSLGNGGLYDRGVSIKEACMASKPPIPALLLLLLTRSIKPLNVIELGTNVGISSAYIAAALKLNGQKGKISTLDASPYRQRIAKEIHHNLGIDNVLYVEGHFSDILTRTLTDLGSVDLAFIDGHHQYQPTLDYFNEIFKFSTPETVFVFDDIRWSDGMKKAWSQIQSDHRLGLAVDLYAVGICACHQQQESSHRLVCDPIFVI